MTERERKLYDSLIGIRNELNSVVKALKQQDGIISTTVLDMLDEINALSVEV